MLEGLVKAAEKALPGATGKEKKAWATEKALALVEMGDDYLPILGAWADLPIINTLEAYLVGLGIERAWTLLKLSE